jgi:hypothetical protein
MAVVRKVKDWWAAHSDMPDSEDPVKACMKATGASRNTAKKYRPKTAAPAAAEAAGDGGAGHDFQATYPAKRHGDTSQQEKPPVTVTEDEERHGDEQRDAEPRVERWRLRL